MLLFEVLIVVAIIAMIAAGVSVAALQYWDRARDKEARTRATTIRSAIRTYWMDHDASECPGVDRLIAASILDEGSPTTDPWGNGWKIECEDTRVTVISRGRDKKPYTDDDIRVPATAVATAENTP
jgi:type II secretory pathway pseudopilin PulG